MNLMDLKAFLDDVTDSFAAVLDLELTVINAHPMVRVSGTGKFKGYGSRNWERTYTYKVLQSGEAMTVLDTSADGFEVSQGQPKYYSIILYPISLDGQVEGVIVLASFTERQQAALVQNREKLLNYTEKTASLISAKLAQERLLELVTASNAQLSGVFESVKGGLLLYATGGCIQQINARARQLLRLDALPAFGELLLEEVFAIAERALERQQIVEQHVNRWESGMSVSLVVQARPIRGSKSSVVCVINPFQDLQNTITQNDSEGIPFQMLSRNPQMLALKARIDQVARHASNVLILGESGTGKELVARTIHRAGPRQKNPFVTVNCAAIPETLLESELFGYEEGAFTGAKKGGRIGKFMLANTGTLFLDEIGDMPLYLQAKLLRVLSDRKVDRIGSSEQVSVDVHIIAATNKNLDELIRKKEFREDLYYRLSVIPFWIPPLRERREDILLLAEHFVEKYNQKLEKQVAGISPGVQRLLLEYHWPGNVRELENCMEYMVNFERGDLLSADNLPHRLQSLPEQPPPQQAPAREPPVQGRTLKQLVRQCEREALARANARYGGHPALEQIREICAELGISISSYYRKMEELELQQSARTLADSGGL